MTAPMPEHLGTFYLGRELRPDTGKPDGAPLLYDSRDLTTHAAIIGMTGSGKTGLGVSLIEEAAIDGIPVLAIDPKGDLTNLALGFPQLRPADFAPWIDPASAARNGHSPEEAAQATAATWKAGLKDWGQDGARIGRMQAAAEVCVYTPGATFGRPLAILQELSAPSEIERQDMDGYAQRIDATTTGLLALIGIDADPITGREHILLSNLLRHYWDAGRGLSLPDLIGAIQNPPIEQIGVMPLESIYPAKDRFGLAMRVNGLLSAPAFAAWMEGEPLDIQRLLYAPDGRPRVCVLSIAHLSDAQRMFFVTMLLNALLGWMRRQPGTSSLRALLYMDEVFGYLPPVGNPPSKVLLLTLLKQARAFGVGLCLSTQNPVDLDYKALSNMGTWFIGRLQTERDKARLLDGLQSAAGGMNRSETDDLISGLGKRKFLLHSVHRGRPMVFGTRWVLSYLAGPLSREQVATLCSQQKLSAPAGQAPAPSLNQRQSASATRKAGAQRPVLPAGTAECFVTPQPQFLGKPTVYRPCLLGAAEMHFVRASAGVAFQRECIHLREADESDWDGASPFAGSPDLVVSEPMAGVRFAALPGGLASVAASSAQQRAYASWLRREQPLTLYQHKKLKLTSQAGEEMTDFLARVRDGAHEGRDLAVDKLRERYAKRMATVERRILSARQRVESESDQASQKQVDVALSVGASLLSAFLGGRRRGVTGMATTARRASRISKERADVKRAQEKLAAAEADLQELEARLEEDIEALEGKYEVHADDLVPLVIRAKSTDIQVKRLAIGWLPWVETPEGGLVPGWRV